MQRYYQRQSRTIDYGYHQQTPFFRQAIAIIDSSTKLMKEDRIFLRNTIKQYMKQLRQSKQRDNEWQQEHIQTLIQIFVEANKKKSLVKIQKGDAIMDWIQIRLRKFIDSHKKEKHKREVETFRNQKYLQIKTSLDIIKSNTNRSRSRQVTSPLEARSKQKQRNIPAVNNNPNKYHKNIASNPHSLSKSNQKLQSIAMGQGHSHYSYHRKFDFLRKSKVEHSRQRSQNTKTPLGSQRPLKDLWKRTSTLSEYSNKSVQKSTVAVLKKSSLNSSKGSSVFNYNKATTKIQTHNQSHPLKEEAKVGPLNQFMQPTKIIKERFNSDLIPKYTEPIFENINFSINQQIRSRPQTNQKRTVHDIVNQTQKLILSSSVSRYQDSTKKIQQMLQKSNILNQLTNKNSDYSLDVNSGQALAYPINKIEPNTISQDLFTPPQLLAQCRKFMSSSKKKDDSAYMQNSVNQKQVQSYQKLTFTDILKESQQRSTEKISKLSYMGINEVVSQNGSLVISSQKPGSQVNFQIRDILINSVEELLLQIFRDGPRNLLDRYQLGLIMSKCSSDCQRLLQEYCDLLTKQTTNPTDKLKFEFVPMVKYLSTYGKVLQDSKQYFSTFLSTILDIKNKGFVNAEDNQSFISSLESSQIESSSLNSICAMLQNVFMKSCEIEGGGCLMTRWSLYYLQIKRDTDLQYLKYLLSKFEFQLDQECDEN